MEYLTIECNISQRLQCNDTWSTSVSTLFIVVCVRLCMCACMRAYACCTTHCTHTHTHTHTHARTHTHAHACCCYRLHLCVAAGKSTFLELLEKAHPEYIIVNEPLVRWQNVPDGEEGLTCSQQHGGNMLDHFYKDPQRWGYTFQV